MNFTSKLLQMILAIVSKAWSQIYFLSNMVGITIGNEVLAKAFILTRLNGRNSAGNFDNRHFSWKWTISGSVLWKSSPVGYFWSTLILHPLIFVYAMLFRECISYAKSFFAFVHSFVLLLRTWSSYILYLSLSLCMSYVSNLVRFRLRTTGFQQAPS